MNSKSNGKSKKKVEKIKKEEEEKVLELNLENKEELDEKEFEKAKQKYDIYKNIKRTYNTSSDDSTFCYDIYIKRYIKLCVNKHMYSGTWNTQYWYI